MRRSPLRRKTPLRRTRLLAKANPTGPSADVVEAVCERAGWACEICSGSVGDRRGVDHHIHHRRARAVGGSRRPDTNRPSNLLLVCPDCHADVESHRAVALSMGWLVPQASDPASTAVLIHRDRWVYLRDSGRYSRFPPIPIEKVS